MVGGLGRTFGYGSRCIRVFIRCARYHVLFKYRPLQRSGQWQYGQLLWPQFGDEPVNERSSPRLRYAALLALLICIVFTQAGCSVSSVTNNGNCDAQGGDNAIKCAQSAKGASSSSARNRSAASNPRLRPSGPVPPTALCSARTLLSYPRATGCR